VADRLDVMGLGAEQVLSDLDAQLRVEAAGLLDEEFLAGSLDQREESEHGQEGELLSSMTGRDWAARMSAVADGPDRFHGRGWLLSLIEHWDNRHRLRAVLLALPDAEVVFDVTWLGENRWRESEPELLASATQRRCGRKRPRTYP
jgi:hypothetical protein